MCLDIFDREVQNGEKEGFYWRKWTTYFEVGRLVVDAESNHTADNHGHYGKDFCYYASIDFDKDLVKGCSRIYMNVELQAFINDALNYKDYITETLNDVEVDIGIWERNSSK